MSYIRNLKLFWELVYFIHLLYIRIENPFFFSLFFLTSCFQLRIGRLDKRTCISMWLDRFFQVRKNWEFWDHKELFEREGFLVLPKKIKTESEFWKLLEMILVNNHSTISITILFINNHQQINGQLIKKMKVSKSINSTFPTI